MPRPTANPPDADTDFATDQPAPFDGAEGWEEHRGELSDHIERAARRGANLLRQQLRDASVEAPPVTVQEIRRYAARRLDDLIPQLDQTTADKLAAGQDPFTDDRANTIAETETAGGFNAGMLMVARKVPGIRKGWVAQASACDQCEELADEPAIGVDEDWDGVWGPPLHPSCACGLSFVLTSGGKSIAFKAFDDSEARDAHGRWVDGAGSLSDAIDEAHGKPAIEEMNQRFTDAVKENDAKVMPAATAKADQLNEAADKARDYFQSHPPEQESDDDVASWREKIDEAKEDALDHSGLSDDDKEEYGDAISERAAGTYGNTPMAAFDPFLSPDELAADEEFAHAHGAETHEEIADRVVGETLEKHGSPDLDADELKDELASNGKINFSDHAADSIAGTHANFSAQSAADRFNKEVSPKIEAKENEISEAAEKAQSHYDEAIESREAALEAKNDQVSSAAEKAKADFDKAIKDAGGDPDDYLSPKNDALDTDGMARKAIAESGLDPAAHDELDSEWHEGLGGFGEIPDADEDQIRRLSGWKEDKDIAKDAVDAAIDGDAKKAFGKAWARDLANTGSLNFDPSDEDDSAKICKLATGFKSKEAAAKSILKQEMAKAPKAARDLMDTDSLASSIAEGETDFHDTHGSTPDRLRPSATKQ